MNPGLSTARSPRNVLLDVKRSL
uniref:Uncharacterized protein n=1 Tax=Anguilla anguilla TaxID=7936 RepID=A0A0E9Q2P5_ANGAN